MTGKAIVGDVLERLAAIEGLVRLSYVGVQLKAADSSKLHRAEDDLLAALQGLEMVQEELSGLATAKARQIFRARRQMFARTASDALRIGKRGG